MVWEHVIHDGWDLEVLEMDRRRVAAVRLTEPPGRIERSDST